MKRGYRECEGFLIRENPRPSAAKLSFSTYSETGEHLELTDRVREDGVLDLTAPAGQWRLWVVSRIAPIQTVKRPAPGNAGYALDPFSASAISEYVKRFSDAFVGFPAPMPNAQFHESFEYFGADWTPGLFDAFQQKRGYDLRSQLPAFAGSGPDDVVKRVRCGYRETMSDLHLDYLNTWSDWAHAQGSLSRNQAHGSPGNLLDHYAAADIPEMEDYKQDRSILVMKFASAAAHTTGKPLVSSETGTWVKEHFTETLAGLKALVDEFFLGGVNRVKFHGAASSPSDVAWPGWMRNICPQSFPALATSRRGARSSASNSPALRSILTPMRW